MHGALAKDLTRQELGRHDRIGKILEERLALAVEPEQDVRHDQRNKLRQSTGIVDRHDLHVGIPLPQGMAGFNQRRAEFLAEHFLDLARRCHHDRLFGFRALRIDHGFANNPDPHAGQGAGVARHPGMTGVRSLEHRGSRNCRKGIARIVVAVVRVLQGIEDFGTVDKRTGMNAGAVAMHVGTDRTTIEAEHRLVR